MPLTDLVLDCLISGASFNESGKRVSVQVRDGERCLFIRSDSDEFRNHLNLNEQRSCDLLVIYSTDGISPLLFFIELKGRDIQSAADQIASTLTAVRTRFNGHQRLRRASYEALVLCSGAPPRQTKQLQKDFLRQHRVALQFISSKQFDLRDKLPRR